MQFSNIAVETSVVFLSTRLQDTEIKIKGKGFCLTSQAIIYYSI